MSVFISHSHLDKPIADAVCAALEASGIDCWIAPRDIPPGSNWAGAIVGAIADCRLLVLIFSSRSNLSQQIHREIELAVTKGIPVIPLRVEEVLPASSLEYFLGTIHWLDAFSPPLERHLQTLVGVAKALLDEGSKGKSENKSENKSEKKPSEETAYAALGATASASKAQVRVLRQVRRLADNKVLLAIAAGSFALLAAGVVGYFVMFRQGTGGHAPVVASNGGEVAKAPAQSAAGPVPSVKAVGNSDGAPGGKPIVLLSYDAILGKWCGADANSPGNLIFSKDELVVIHLPNYNSDTYKVQHYDFSDTAVTLYWWHVATHDTTGTATHTVFGDFSADGQSMSQEPTEHSPKYSLHRC